MSIDDFKRRFLFLNEFKILFILLALLLCIGLLGQYSAFNGEINTFVQRHLFRIVSSVVCMFLVYSVNFRFWSSYAYVFYGIIFVGLVIVEILGTVKLGAQRWINLYFFTFQPSELMKIALVLALARYYALLTPLEISDLKKHIAPFLLTIIPAYLILKQPDLGTASLLFFVGIGIIFMSGFPLKAFFGFIVAGIALCPLGWFFLHNYQRQRILTFFNPDRDPSGSGYHVLQSKIAIGSGHIFGRGFLEGTQSKLNFLPEKNTDFIFTTIAEETGFVGSVIIISLFLFVTLYFIWAASTVRNTFAKLMCYGLSVLLFMHVFINIAMVMGLVPVVGIPLPFLSYGGSSMLTFSFSCGLVMSALAYKKSY